VTDIIPVDALRDRIAIAFASQVKAYNVPAVCVRFGIQKAAEEGDKDEAFRSRRMYVKQRLLNLDQPALLRIARAFLREYADAALAETVSEMTTHAVQRISTLVRSDVLKVLNRLDRLFGDRDLIENLCEIFGDSQIRSPSFEFFGLTGLEENIAQHYLRNNDWSNEELLTHCGALTCSQTRFFSLVDRLLHPMVRRGDEQVKLADALSSPLKRDGFVVQQVTSQSGYPIFGVVRTHPGVSGAMKNLIFASAGEKPELVFRDAVNNDVEIVRNADKVLIYDRPLPASGMLLWMDLQSWWQELHALNDPDLAKGQLYRRLLQSVRATKSAGEFAIFRSYYERYGSQLSATLPALLPQVYLHYDPYTKRERGEERFLARQRMDFLLMLDHGVRIVIEVDGRHHYAVEDAAGTGKYIADAKLYADMSAEDRRLRLAGYEVYRFGGAEFMDVNPASSTIGAETQALLGGFFDRLFKRHQIN
jgi:AbiJ-like protein